MNTNNESSVENRLSNLENAKSIIQCNIPMSVNKQLGQLPYDFYYGSAVVYNNEIHILGSGDSSSRTRYFRLLTSLLDKYSLPKDMIITISSYDSKTETSKLQSLGNNKYKVLEDKALLYTQSNQNIVFSLGEDS